MTQKTCRLELDPNRCQGHARCAVLAPELFGVDEIGNGRLLGDGVVPSDLFEKAYLAQSNCPEAAIKIIEGDQ
jgi:ferredoxin